MTNANFNTDDDGQSDRRRTGRRLQEFLESDLGIIIDLSAGGARLITNRPLEGECDMTLRDAAEEVTVHVLVAWCHELEVDRYLVGLTFIGVDRDLASALTRLSTAHARLVTNYSGV